MRGLGGGREDCAQRAGKKVKQSNEVLVDGGGRERREERDASQRGGGNSAQGIAARGGTHQDKQRTQTNS